MLNSIDRANKLAIELGDICNALVDKTDDFDLKRLFKRLEADTMDFRHKLSQATEKLKESNNRN